MEEKEQIIVLMRKLSDSLRNILTQGYVDGSPAKDKEKLKELLVALVGTLSDVATITGVKMDEIEELVNRTIAKKKPVERMKKHAIAMGDFLNNGFTVLTGSPEEMLKQLEAYIRHAENLWENAVMMFQKSSYAIACFLSIVCIEECSKISFGEFQFYSTVMRGKSSVEIKPRGKNPLSQHNKKHFVAACSGALVNTRMDNIVGVDKVTEFIEDCEAGKLERVRQMCLYADVSKEGAIVIPEAVVTKEQAAFYITVAGLLLSQIEGAESLRNGFQAKAEKFAAEHFEIKKPI